MRTSARNQFLGVVKQVVPGQVNAEVKVTLPGGAEIVAIVTLDSVEPLGLVPGKQVWALVKAQSVLVAPGSERLTLSARNRYQGKIEKLVVGAVNTEVQVRLDSSALLCAIITKSSAETLALTVGESAWAFFKAGSVILAIEG